MVVDYEKIVLTNDDGDKMKIYKKQCKEYFGYRFEINGENFDFNKDDIAIIMNAIEQLES